ncbi:UvrD-helicase domain-containing protein [Glutamicibacter creatinolyticus]|uniref:UvrD-helicase domain-containing protein n=1 Tax=Glutamicibacter creatinolyticus TaxID=162496 RepID=UPI0034104222
MVEDPRIEDAVEAVLTVLPCSVTLPAGAGKTELIAAAVAEAARRGGTSLVLTHTHAGVDALRRRMKKFGVANDRVLVRTIDSWAYDLIAHFPDLSGLAVPAAPDWSRSSEYHRAAARAARSRGVVRMLGVSYTHLFVDEYQDCLTDQHELVLSLAAALPTAVFGDPLQSLFNFSRNRPVEWKSDVLSNFPRVPVEYRPRRWARDHQALGTWLLSIRNHLFNGEPIDLASGPVTWVRREGFGTYVGVCFEASKLDGTIAVLGQFRPDCVKAASSLKGTYSVMEAIDEKLPMTLAQTIDVKDGAEIAQAVVDFAVACSIGLSKHISVAKRKQLGEGRSFSTKRSELQPAYKAVLRVRSAPESENIRAALELLGKLPNVAVHCREAWDEIINSVTIAGTEGCSVAEALLRTRNHSRAVGRRNAARVVSRPLLVKGLEYDHVVILNPERYSAQELYVALTRGSKSVTVISDEAVLPVAKMAVRKE